MLGFTNLAALWLLLLVPAVLWLARFRPTAPHRVIIPSLFLLSSVAEQAPRAPKPAWWLIILRGILLVCLIIALAQPFWQKANMTQQPANPVVMLIDRSWASGAVWPQLQQQMLFYYQDSVRAGRQPTIFLLPERDQQSALPPTSWSDIAQLTPQPVILQIADFARLDQQLAVLAEQYQEPLDIVIFTGRVEAVYSSILESGQQYGNVTLVVPPLSQQAWFIEDVAFADPVENATRENGLNIAVRRSSSDQAATNIVRAYNHHQEIIAEYPFAIEASQELYHFTWMLPTAQLNNLSWLALSEYSSAGGAWVLSSPGTRPIIGVISGARDQFAPLRDSITYIEQAFQPFAEIRMLSAAALTDLRAVNLPLIIVPDGVMTERQIANLRDQIANQGGVLLRFGGPALADRLIRSQQQSRTPPTTPLPLNLGMRYVDGGYLTQTSGDLYAENFVADTPLAALPAMPQARVFRQFLAAPPQNPSEEIWATLSDGTPLISAQILSTPQSDALYSQAPSGPGTGQNIVSGTGWYVFVHTGLQPEWSELAFSPFLVHFAQRITAFAGSFSSSSPSLISPNQANLTLPGETAPLEVGFGNYRTQEEDQETLRSEQEASEQNSAESSGYWHARLVFDGFGRLAPPDHILTTTTRDLDQAPHIETPPGLYQSIDRLTEQHAHNLGPSVSPSLTITPGGNYTDGWLSAQETSDLSVVFWSLALLCFILDVLASLLYQHPAHHWFSRFLRKTPGEIFPHAVFWLGGTLCIATLDAKSVYAQMQSYPYAEEEPLVSGYLTYILTNDPQIDRASRAGLEALAYYANLRSAVQNLVVRGLTPEDPEILRSIIIYWPVGDVFSAPEDTTYLLRYLDSSGLIFFDLRNQLILSPALQNFLGALGMLRLTIAPENHVIWRSFYLLSSRATARNAQEEILLGGQNIDIPAIIIGQGNFAEAWALDELGRPLFPMGRSHLQREDSIRFGLNILIYALTGNYKDDQIHLPILLDRLGQEAGPQPSP